MNPKIKKELQILSIFFITGLAIILTSFVLYHVTSGIKVTTEEMLNSKAPIWALPNFFRIIWYMGFIIWLSYPVYLIIRAVGAIKTLKQR